MTISPASAEGAPRVTFRFGLSALRWGHEGQPAVLMMHGVGGRPAQFTNLIPPLLARERQVIALEAPAHEYALDEEATQMELAMAMLEAAVEIRELETVVGHSLGAAAAALALAHGLPADRAVLLAPASTITAGDAAFARTLRKLDIPALVVHDSGDTIVPHAEAQAIARAWPGAQLLTTTGLGHWKILADPGVAEHVADFVARRRIAARTLHQAALATLQ
ncbi:MAG TPA: alpha/beta fold hydrolase [Nevskiaceae bacterium]|nr:alpha/beta fold hydrolase [Nevskiaceae bacterium]